MAFSIEQKRKWLNIRVTTIMTSMSVKGKFDEKTKLHLTDLLDRVGKATDVVQLLEVEKELERYRDLL